MPVLEIKDLHVAIEGKEILKGVNLTLKTGENSCGYGTKRDWEVHPSGGHYG